MRAVAARCSKRRRHWQRVPTSSSPLRERITTGREDCSGVRRRWFGARRPRSRSLSVMPGKAVGWETSPIPGHSPPEGSLRQAHDPRAVGCRGSFSPGPRIPGSSSSARSPRRCCSASSNPPATTASNPSRVWCRPAIGRCSPSAAGWPRPCAGKTPCSRCSCELGAGRRVTRRPSVDAGQSRPGLPGPSL